jgi:hypothetical protein
MLVTQSRRARLRRLLFFAPVLPERRVHCGTLLEIVVRSRQLPALEVRRQELPVLTLRYSRRQVPRPVRVDVYSFHDDVALARPWWWRRTIRGGVHQQEQQTGRQTHDERRKYPDAPQCETHFGKSHRPILTFDQQGSLLEFSHSRPASTGGGRELQRLEDSPGWPSWRSRGLRSCPRRTRRGRRSS